MKSEKGLYGFQLGDKIGVGAVVKEVWIYFR